MNLAKPYPSFRILLLLTGFLGAMSPSGFSKSKTGSFSIDFTVSQTAEQQTNILRTSDGISPFRLGEPAFFLSPTQTIPVTQSFPFLTLAPTAEASSFDPALLQLQVRFSANGSTWSGWQAITRFEEGVQNEQLFIGNLMYLDTTMRHFQYMVLFNQNVQSLAAVKLKNLRFDFFSPGQVQVVGPGSFYQLPGHTNENAQCQCDLPAFANRTDWNCPDGQAPSCSAPEFTPTTHMVIHHSAGPNSSSNWAATVLSIWNFHVNTNGWCDIGYNWIIDPNGVIYEGRGGGDNVRGAHFCATNSNTMGICLLGTFTSQSPSEAAINSLRKLLAWKSCQEGLDPLAMTFHPSSGKNLHTISGHQDGCSTACPGTSFYQDLPSLRIQVDTALAACQGLSSIDQDLALPNFQLYPNPARQEFRLSWDQLSPANGNLLLLSAEGRVVRQMDLSLFPGYMRFSVQISDLPSGWYLLQVEAGNLVQRKKVLVSH